MRVRGVLYVFRDVQALRGGGFGIILRGKKDSQELSGKGGKKPGKIRAQATDEVLANIIYASSMKEKARYLQPDLTGKVELIPSFERLNNRWSVEFKIGSSQKYVVKKYFPG